MLLSTLLPQMKSNKVNGGHKKGNTCAPECVEVSRDKVRKKSWSGFCEKEKKEVIGSRVAK